LALLLLLVASFADSFRLLPKMLRGEGRSDGVLVLPVEWTEGELPIPIPLYLSAFAAVDAWP
jgi:hypothetical protein